MKYYPPVIFLIVVAMLFIAGLMLPPDPKKIVIDLPAVEIKQISSVGSHVGDAL